MLDSRLTVAFLVEGCLFAVVYLFYFSIRAQISISIRAQISRSWMVMSVW